MDFVRQGQTHTKTKIFGLEAKYLVFETTPLYFIKQKWWKSATAFLHVTQAGECNTKSLSSYPFWQQYYCLLLCAKDSNKTITITVW